MIKITRGSNLMSLSACGLVFDDFHSKSGEYSCPNIAIIAFATILGAYNLSFGPNIDTHYVTRNGLFDILSGGERIGYAHIAWCRHPDGRYSVTGRIM